ncbi:MAG: TetR/AcrR family transcriptional regulator [Pseudomonadota bacterium]
MALPKVKAADDITPALAKILEAAEAEFADKGFDGAGMKALALRAGVSQSLLHYHFGSKDQLYAAVIRARSRKINAERLERLAAVDLVAADALHQVFSALFAPALGPSGGGRAYARIFAGLIVGNEMDQALVRECYDPTAKIFLNALETALGGVDRASAAQVYQFSLGTLAAVIAKDGRAERLADGKTAQPDDAALLDRLVQFVVGGARSIAAPQT